MVLMHEIVACSLEEPGQSTTCGKVVYGEEETRNFDPYQTIDEADRRFPIEIT